MFSAIKSSPSTITVPHPNVPVPMTLAACKQNNQTNQSAINRKNRKVFREFFPQKPGDVQSSKPYCSKSERWFPGRFRRRWWSFSSWVRKPVAGKSPVRDGSQSDKCFQEEPSQLRPERSSNRRNHLAQPSPFESSPYLSQLSLSLSSGKTLVIVYKNPSCVDLQHNFWFGERGNGL